MAAGSARANRLRVAGGVFHLTHRCHNRAFLLKFARDRDAYRSGICGKVKPLILSRRETEIVPTADNAWVLQEAVIAYGQETDLKNASKPIK